MAKRKSSNQRLPSEVSLLSPSLQRYYRIGFDANDVKFQDKQGLRDLAAKLNRKRGDMPKLNSDTLLKARRFVERLSDKRSLKLLCQRRKTPNGRKKKGDPILGWAHVRHLVSVANKGQRSKLLKEAVKHDWSIVQLVEAIQLRVGRIARPKNGGRPPAKAQSSQEVLLRLQRLTEAWLAHYKLMMRPRWTQKDPVEPRKKNVIPNRLREQIQASLRSGSAPSGAEQLDVQVKEFLRVLRKQQRRIAKILVTGEAWLRDQPRDTSATRNSPKRVTRPKRRHQTIPSAS